MPRLKGLLRDRVFSRTHLRSSLTPEEGPSLLFFFGLPVLLQIEPILKLPTVAIPLYTQKTLQK